MAATPTTPAAPAGDLKSRLDAVVKAHEGYVADVPSLKVQQKEFEELLEARAKLVAIIRHYGGLLDETDVKLDELATILNIDLEAQYGIVPQSTEDDEDDETPTNRPRGSRKSFLDWFNHDH